MSKYSSYLLYLLTSILIVILYANQFSPIESLQQSLDDALCRITAPEGPRPNIALIMIDGKAQDEFGNWPWNYDLIADLSAATASSKPKAILFDFPLREDSYQDSAGYTEILAQQLQWIDKAVLPYDIAVSTYRKNITSNPPRLFHSSIPTDNPLGLMNENASLQVGKVFLPAEKLIEHKPNLGFVYDAPDDDRILRHQPLTMNYEGYYYPSQSLLAASVYLDIPYDQIVVKEFDNISVGDKKTIKISEQSNYFIRFSKEMPFKKYSASQVLSDDFDRSKLAGKMVLIGVDNTRGQEIFTTPVNEEISPIIIKASVIDNIINDNMIQANTGSGMVSMLILFLLGGVCAFVLPRMNLLYRILILSVGLIILANINYFMVSSFGIIPESVFIALELLLFMIASPLLDSNLLAGESSSSTAIPSKAKKVDSKSKKKKKSEELEDLPPVREIKASATDQDNLATRAVSNEDQESNDYSEESTSAVSFESDGAVIDDDAANESVSIIDADDSGQNSLDNYGSIDIDDSTKEPDAIDSNPIDIAQDSGQMVGLTSSQQIKNLGRYQIDEVLGKGAMGLVYKGIDPAINRPVALKTIRLDFVNDPEEMAELKERLFREAQAVGKLSHPNIVTIYDAGSEGHLQYIAMEYLQGQTLEDMIKKKTKFNYRIIAKIITQICAALEYAHERGIVHRDIKPANIMILQDYQVKVMDYGIARIDSNSMTKTGIAMGTPNYISPEQLKGLAIDRRADIFSLGVVMYEMLLGKRPFKGENITSLIYSILNHEPEKPSNINPQIPLLFDHIIAKSLHKEPSDRYQKATEITSDLADFVESFSSR